MPENMKCETAKHYEMPECSSDKHDRCDVCGRCYTCLADNMPVTPSNLTRPDGRP